MVKRWIIDTTCECGRFGDDVGAWEDKDGEWVKYEDIKHLLQNTSSNKMQYGRDNTKRKQDKNKYTYLLLQRCSACCYKETCDSVGKHCSDYKKVEH